VSSEQLDAYSACTLGACCTREARAEAGQQASSVNRLCVGGKGSESMTAAQRLAGSVLGALKAGRNSSTTTGMRGHVARLLSRAAQCRRAHGLEVMPARMKRGGTKQRQLAATVTSPVQRLHQEQAHSLNLAQRIPRAFWRGSNTGNYRGWSSEVLASMHDGKQKRSTICCTWCHRVANNLGSAPCNTWAGAIGTELLNKRTYAALLSLTHPWLDVGLSMYLK
jgi:hypothetical protein